MQIKIFNSDDCDRSYIVTYGKLRSGYRPDKKIYPVIKITPTMNQKVTDAQLISDLTTHHYKNFMEVCSKLKKLYKVRINDEEIVVIFSSEVEIVDTYGDINAKFIIENRQ